MNFIYQIQQVLGTDVEARELSWLQVSLRAAIVFIFAMIIVRFGARRFLARLTAVDAILGFILGSMLSRSINGSAPFFPSLAGGFVLVLFHRLVVYWASRSHWVSLLVKGRGEQLVSNGRVDHHLLRRHSLSENDLMEELRLNGSVGSPAQVECATLERSGQISVIKKQDG